MLLKAFPIPPFIGWEASHSPWQVSWWHSFGDDCGPVEQWSRGCWLHLVCWFFLITAGMTGACAGRWGRRNPNSGQVVENYGKEWQTLLSLDMREPGIDLTVDQHLESPVLQCCVQSRETSSSEVLPVSRFSFRWEGSPSCSSRFSFNLLSWMFTNTAGLRPTHVKSSPGADELKVEVQSSKVKLTEILHKGETP